MPKKNRLVGHVKTHHDQRECRTHIRESTLIIVTGHPRNKRSNVIVTLRGP